MPSRGRGSRRIAGVVLAILLAIFGLGAAAARADDPAPATAAPAPATATPAPATVTPAPAATQPNKAAADPPSTITGLAVLADGATKRQSQNFQMGDKIDVKLSKGTLAALQKAAADKKKRYGLLLNGHFLEDVPALVIGTEEILFLPIRNDANKAFWDELWGGRLLTPQALSVAVGLEDSSLLVVQPESSNVLMEPLQGAKAISLVSGGVGLLALMIFLAIRTSLIRDGAKLAGGGLPTYSLARTQMAFWFLNVVLSVLLIWAVTGSVPPITGSVLGLIGIGTGTALGAALVDQNSDDRTPKLSVSFLKDILTDGGVLGLHRFQMVAWTVVLFFIFWGAVWNKLALPEFDNTLLALMGVSAGAYLGFKVPENQPPPTPKPVKTDGT